MNNLLNRAVRPLAALTIVGAIAAVAALALLALPNSKPAEAQTDANVTITRTADSVVIAATDVTEVTISDYVRFAVPGYQATRQASDLDDPSTFDADKACGVAAVSTATPNGIINTGGTAFGCKTNSDGDGVVGYFWSATAPADFTITISDVAMTAAAQAAASGRTASEVGYVVLEESDGTPDDASDFAIATAAPIGYAAGANGNSYYLPGTNDIDVSSTSTNVDVQIQVRIGSVQSDLEGGSSVVLYLEDDYTVPSNFQERFAWFTVSGVTTSGQNVRQAGSLTPAGPAAGRHTVIDLIEFAEDDYSGVGDGTSIRFYLPDMRPGDSPTTEGFQGPKAGQTLTLTISKQAGIQNPSEEGSHGVGYALLTPEQPDVPSTVPNVLPDKQTVAKIKLSDDDDARGKVVTVTGSGFNDKSAAFLRVKHYANADLDAGTGTADAGTVAAFAAYNQGAGIYPGVSVNDTMTEEQTCLDILLTGSELHTDQKVQADDTAAVTFTVANPPFRPGPNNLLCMSDGEGRMASTDVENFNLDPSISIVNNTVNAGEQVTVNAVDFPGGATLTWLEVLGSRVTPSTSPNIAANGKATITFDMPGNLDNAIKVEVCYGGTDNRACTGGDKESALITVVPSELSLSKTEVRPNESIIIRGSGFNKSSTTTLTSAQIGDVDMLVVSDGGDLDEVDVSSSGQFAATFAIWPADSTGDNPTLGGGTLTIDITDSSGFSGTAKVTILEPTLTVTPEVAGPRDYVSISGSNWPVDNSDGGDVSQVDVKIKGSGFSEDTENEDPDANGNWTIQYRVPGTVGIPSTVNVEASYGTDITESTSFSVPSANLQISPATVVPGGDLTLNASGFSLYESNITVDIGSQAVSVPTGTSTNREGEVKDLTVKVPSLDAGTYTVQLKVGETGGATVAIGTVVVLSDDAGGEDALPGALDALDTNLVRVFHFNNATKSWSFYDPRPEFAELNTLSALTTGESYWILVTETESVTLNATAHNLTCLGGDCWNQLVW